MPEYDAAISGGGPNGLAAAIRLQQAGLKTVLFEQAARPGGAARTEELTLPGFYHDIGSSIHPLTYASPFFKTLPLERHGLEWIHPDIPFAHPFPDGDAYACYQSIEETATQFTPADGARYRKIYRKLLKDWPAIDKSLLAPLKVPPKNPLKMASFGLKALLPAKTFVHLNFREEKTRALFYGAAAHSFLPMTSVASASFGLVLNALAHYAGWPFPKGGAQTITNALVSFYRSLGGQVVLNTLVKDIADLPSSSAYLFDLTPRQLLQIKGTGFSSRYRKRMEAYRYGAGVFKLDWALSDPIPFTNEKCRKAGTVHLGYSTSEIEVSEKIIHSDRIAEKPYVLLAQHTVFDPARAPAGRHTAWAYCHVPYGSRRDMTGAIEDQVEKAAPGFKDCILGRSALNTHDLERFNPNLVGGDINGGKQDIFQLFTRPVARLSPYTTPNPRVYICSSSTPPGGGVHGMCGFHAAERAIKDHF